MEVMIDILRDSEITEISDTRPTVWEWYRAL